MKTSENRLSGASKLGELLARELEEKERSLEEREKKLAQREETMAEIENEVAEQIEQKRLQSKISMANWRAKYPEKYREIYIRYFRKKRGYYSVSELDNKKPVGGS